MTDKHEKQPGDECDWCPHPFDEHGLVATTGNPLEGGIILCPELGCGCYATWGREGEPAKYVPDVEETARIRAMIQEEAARERRSAEDPG